MERRMNLAGSPWPITPVHLLQRARCYRLAEAIADAPQDIAMFRNLALMFERLAAHLTRFESRKVPERRSIARMQK
jgi:hypothetical protein